MEMLIGHGDATARDALMRAIGDAGGSVEFIEAGNGDEALEVLLRDKAPRLAVMDRDMPGVDGLELCRLVRDFHLEGPPYILLLVAGRDADVEIGLEAGANDCLRTPASAAEIRERVGAGRRFVEVPWERATRGATLEAVRLPDDEAWDAFGMMDAPRDVNAAAHTAPRAELQAVLSER